MSQKILSMFISILCDGGRTFPVKTVSSANHDRSRLYREFKAKLQLFWHGSRVDFTSSGYPRTSNDGMTLILPTDVKTRQDLYKRLIVATFNMETGNQIYGGSIQM